MDADEIVDLLRPVPRERIDARMLAHLRKAERTAGCRCSVYELPTGAIIVVAHRTPEPSRDLLLRAIEAHIANNSKPEGTA